MKLKNKAQQEMVGFILIVVLVMIGLVVFLVISARVSPKETSSLKVENMLGAIMKQTTDCDAEPFYKNFEDLFKECYQGSQCNNLDESACKYLNESLTKTLETLMDSEATVSAYQMDFSSRDDSGQSGILRISAGNCTGEVSGAQRSIVSGSDSLIIRLKTCSKS